MRCWDEIPLLSLPHCHMRLLRCSSGVQVLETCEQKSFFAFNFPSLGSPGVIPNPALTPWVVWGKLILSCSCLESETSSESPEPSEGAEPAEEESALHCLWVDKFTPRRYLELLSDDVRC